MTIQKAALDHKLPAPARVWAAKRLVGFACLALAQVAIISYLFYFPISLAEWVNPVAFVKRFARVGVLSLIVFGLLIWPRRHLILAEWAAACSERRWSLAIAANAGIFLLLVAATVAFTRHVAASPEPPWLLFGAYCGLLLANAVSLVLVAAPARFWLRLLLIARVEALLALIGAVLIQLASELARESWQPLSTATLVLSSWILSLYEANVVVDFGRQILGAGDFRVSILAECSGYEGVGLILAFLSLYLWIFRADLRFPNAFILLPVGAIAIWLLNALRIAALVSIGAHLSPEVAVNGFHSQAGWIAFLLVSAGFMVAAHKSSFLCRRPTIRKPHGRAEDRLLLALLLPFMAMLASIILAQVFAPNDQWFHGLKAAVILGVLWLYRDVYAGFATKASPLAIFAGAAVGALWIATDPSTADDGGLHAWVLALPAWAAGVWIAQRALSSIILVPIAEELAFRGYLHRALIARKFDTVALSQFSWLAFVGSSALFGLMHQRWLAGALAGGVFALVMYRTGKLADPIAAHMTANGVIFVWAIAASQWSLL